MEGLQDIAPIVAKRCVISAVCAPIRAAAAAASQPAWPPPTTITSKWPSIAISKEDEPFYRKSVQNAIGDRCFT